MKVVNNGVTLEVLVEGNGFPVLLLHGWPEAKELWANQVPALVGSVIRAKPHDGAPAGFVASFIAVKQP